MIISRSAVEAYDFLGIINDWPAPEAPKVIANEFSELSEFGASLWLLTIEVDGKYYQTSYWVDGDNCLHDPWGNRKRIHFYPVEPAQKTVYVRLGKKAKVTT